MLDNIWFLNTLIGYENVEYRQKYRHFLLQPEAKNCGTADTPTDHLRTLAVLGAGFLTALHCLFVNESDRAPVTSAACEPAPTVFPITLRC